LESVSVRADKASAAIAPAGTVPDEREGPGFLLSSDEQEYEKDTIQTSIFFKSIGETSWIPEGIKNTTPP